jgi:hypothetical protein
MRNSKNTPISAIPVFLFVAGVLLAASAVTVGDWLKMNPPPDIDKVDYPPGNAKSCWVAAASNQLAGAGYGDGNNVQERADDIYRELCGNLVDCNCSGWAETAISKWLGSEYNNYLNNPYIVANVYGKDPNRPPYARTDLPEVIGNDLRKCYFISLSIRQPTCDANTGKGGHAVTCWGDNGADANNIDSNPTKVKITDSDYWDEKQILQTYAYDDYNNPNPGDTDDCNEGPGWYFNYDTTCHWYIDHFVTLEPCWNTHGWIAARTLVTSAKFSYNGNDPCALDLHYKISSDKQLLSYRTSIDWDTNHTPSFFEDTNYVNVTWDLSDHPVPKGSTITATAEIIVPYIGVSPMIEINNVLWTPMLIQPLPGARWWGQNHTLPGGSTFAPVPNMCGGYVIYACTLYAGPSGPPIGEYRGQFQYDYYEDPCLHEIIFLPEPATYFMGNFRFGHSYGLLMDDELPRFNDWKTILNDYPPFPPLGARTFVLDWTGQLPYPKGQDHIMPTRCGDPGTFYADGDINKDCKVDWQDFARFADSWLWCTDPNQANCP